MFGLPAEWIDATGATHATPYNAEGAFQRGWRFRPEAEIDRLSYDNPRASLSRLLRALEGRGLIESMTVGIGNVRGIALTEGGRRLAEKLAGRSATPDPARSPRRGLALSAVGQDRADHEELGLPLGATAKEIKSAYKVLARLYHPDRPDGGNEARFISVTKAKTGLLQRLEARTLADNGASN